MPSTPPASPDERRAAAQESRLRRTRRIAQLRRQVLATALATFALAFGLIAFDGSMGQGQASSANTAAAAPSSRPTTDDLGAAASDDTFDDTGSGDGSTAAAAPATGSSSDALTTSQS